MAKEGEDAVQVANAALRLGRNYEQAKDSETAIQVGGISRLLVAEAYLGGICPLPRSLDE